MDIWKFICGSNVAAIAVAGRILSKAAMLLALSLPLSALAECPNGNTSPYKGKTLTANEVNEVLFKHREVLAELKYNANNSTLDELNQLWLQLKGQDLKDRRADFGCATLPAYFGSVLLAEVYFQYATIAGGQFGGADLQGADFTGAILTNADFNRAKLLGTGFAWATLKGANFTDADVRHTVFHGAHLQGAKFGNGDLSDADFAEADLEGATFEPGLKNFSASFRQAKGLEGLTFTWDADSLLTLRDEFKKASRRDLERRVTFAIEHTRTMHAFQWHDWLSAIPRYVGWELPTAYDASPNRSLAILMGLIVLFAVPYAIALARPSPKIWRVLPADRLGGDGKQVIEPLHVRGLERLRFALVFSISSAFQLGWHDLNVGSWLTRLQATEYSLRGSGWVRTMSGAQSLLSVYLLAMWALTQFGRLFEG